MSLAVVQDSSLKQYRLVSRKNFPAMANSKEKSGIPNSIKDQWDNEAPRKKVETAVTFPNDPGVIHKNWQRFYGGLPARIDRDFDRDPLPTVIRQSEENV